MAARWGDFEPPIWSNYWTYRPRTNDDPYHQPSTKEPTTTNQCHSPIYKSLRPEIEFQEFQGASRHERWGLLSVPNRREWIRNKVLLSVSSTAVLQSPWADSSLFERMAFRRLRFLPGIFIRLSILCKSSLLMPGSSLNSMNVNTIQNAVTNIPCPVIPITNMIQRP